MATGVDGSTGPSAPNPVRAVYELESVSATTHLHCTVVGSVMGQCLRKRCAMIYNVQVNISMSVTVFIFTWIGEEMVLVELSRKKWSNNL